MLAKLFEWYTLTGDCFLSSHNGKHHCYHHLFYVQEINGFFSELDYQIRCVVNT